MIAQIEKGLLAGTVEAPPSKSMAHRYLICGALAGESVIESIAPSKDMEATVRCLEALGAEVSIKGTTAYICRAQGKESAAPLHFDCGESGSTLRFFIPLALAFGKKATFSGAGRLMERPLTVYEALSREKGFSFALKDGILHTDGRLAGGEFTVDGSVSSQFITGLLFALPLLREECTIHILPPFESRSYVLLTLQALDEFGVHIDYDGAYTLHIPAMQRFSPRHIRVEGDYSNAAFLDVFNYIGGDVCVTGLSRDSLQGDRVYGECFAALAAGRPTIDITDCPDLGPILMALAALKNGALLQGTARLAVKESDRGRVMAEELSKLGAKIRINENSIDIEKAPLSSIDTPLCGHNDHRIVMALATVLTVVGGRIEGAEAVNKSFPDYFDRLRELKARVNLF